MNIASYIDNIVSNNYKIVNSKKKQVREGVSEVLDFKNKNDQIEKVIKKIKKYDRDNFIKSSVKKDIDSLIDAYNNLQKSNNDIKDKNLKKVANSIASIFENNKSELKKIGIKIEKNKCSFNEEVYEKLTDKEIKKVTDNLFLGTESMVRKVELACRKNKKLSENNEYITRNIKIDTVINYSNEDILLANSALNLKQSVNALNNSNMETFDEIKGLLTNFITSYNNMLGSGMKQNDLNKMEELISNPETQTLLSIIDIEVTKGESDYSSLISNENNNNSDIKCNTSKSLFKDPGVFAESLDNFCNILINDVLKSEKTGINIDLSI